MNFENDPIADKTSAVMHALKAKVEHTSGVDLTGAAYNRIFELIYSYEKRLSKYETENVVVIVDGMGMSTAGAITRLTREDFEPMLLKSTLQETSDLIEVLKQNDEKRYGSGKVRSKRTNYTPKKKKRK